MGAWRTVRVASLAAPGSSSMATGPFGSSIGSKFFRSSGVPIIRGGNLSTDSAVRLCDENLVFLDPSKAAEFSRSTVRRGDLIFTCWGTINQVGLVDEAAGYKKYIISNKQMKLTPDPSSADSEFLYYLFSSPRMQTEIVEGSIGSSIPGFNLTRLRSLEIELPALDEQKRIALALSDAEGVEIAIGNVIAKKRAIRRGMMLELLTGGTRLPGFSKTWRDVTFGEHVRYVKAIALSRAQLDSESPIRYLHYGDIHTRSSVRLDAAHEPMPRASSELLRNSEVLQVGDLVFADASEDPEGVGKSVELTSVPADGVVPGLHTIAARFDKTVLADGFKSYLQFIPSFRRSLLRLAAGTKVLATTRSCISSITLCLPDIAEQAAIAAVLIDVDIEIERLETRLAKAREIKQGMMQTLLTGRIRLPISEVAA